MMYLLYFTFAFLIKDTFSYSNYAVQNGQILFDYESGTGTGACGSATTWYADGVGISSSSKYDVSSTRLIVKNIRKADIQKSYRCDSTNLIKKVAPFLFQVDYLMVTTTEGYKAELACYLLVGTESNPSPTLTWSWYKDSGTVISNGGRFKIESSSEKSKLSIEPSEMGDNGVYFCRVDNNDIATSFHVRNTTLRMKSKLTPVWPFLGTLFEIGLVVLIIFGTKYYLEKKEAEKQENQTQTSN